VRARLLLAFGLLCLPPALPAAEKTAALADCGQPGVTELAAIRGLDQPALAEGTAVVVEATVTASFPGDAQLSGFYLQQELPRAGIFVYAPDLTADTAPRAGERWRVLARTGRYRGRVQLEWVEDLRRCGESQPRPAILDPGDPEAYAVHEDQLVTLDTPLVVADTYELGRYGSLRLAMGGRAFTANNGVSAGRLLPLRLDDGSYRRDPRPVPHLGDQGVRRAGDRLLGVTGILTRAFGAWRIHPVSNPVFSPDNPRPEMPAAAAAGGLRVLQLNLRNYFLDLGQRGAASAEALTRQRARLRQLIRPLSADVLVLHEVQNTVAAVDDLLAILNEGLPEDLHYRAALDARSPAAIRSVVLYRDSRARKVRTLRLVDDAHPRDPLVVEFMQPDGKRWGILAAHFKSRGGCPDAGDTDRGEGCWAQRRERQSDSLLEWLSGHSLLPADHYPMLVLADFNAYAEEAAMQTWHAAGFMDLIAREIPAERRYTYIYRGQSGYLDHALATPAMREYLASIELWPVNADEPAYLSDEGKAIWRISDHDPMVIDLRLP